MLLLIIKMNIEYVLKVDLNTSNVTVNPDSSSTVYIGLSTFKYI